MLNVIIGEKLYDQQYVQTYVEGFEQIADNVKDFTPEEMEPICGIPADTLREVARTYRARRKRHHLLGHGRVAAHPRHRQCALPDRAVADLRPGRPSRHRPASAARPEQRAGRLRRRPHPDVLPRLQVGGESGDPRQIRKGLGQDARSQARQDRGRDHGRGACRRDQGHVHHGRKSGDVRPRSQPRARRARPSRMSGGAGHLPHRDRLLRRRDPAGLGLAGEGRHRHQHQSPGADGPQGAAAAGRHAAGFVDHPGPRPAHGRELELQARQRSVRGDGAADAGARQHHLGPRRARGPRHLSGRRAGHARPRRGVRQGLPAPERHGEAGRRQAARRRTRRRTTTIRSSSPPAASSSIGTPAR